MLLFKQYTLWIQIFFFFLLIYKSYENIAFFLEYKEKNSWFKLKSHHINLFCK